MPQARSTFIAASVLVLAVYGISLAIMPKHVFWSPDEGAKLIQAETIRWDRGLVYEIPYAARFVDPDLVLYPSRCRHNDIYPDPSRGEVRLHWPIWFSLVSKGSYALFGVTGLYILPLLCGWLTAVASGWVIRRSFPDLSAAAVLVVGLASPIFFYSLCFWEHTPATLLGVLALGWVARRRPGELSVWWIAGPLLALSVLLRIEMVAFGMSLFAAWSLRLWCAQGNAPTRSTVAKNARRAWFTVAILVLAIVAVFLSVLTPRHWESEPLHQGLWLYTLEKVPALLDAAVAILSNSPGHRAPVVAWRWELLGLGAFLSCLAGAAFRNPKRRALFLVPGLSCTMVFSAVLLLWREPYISLHGFVPVAPYVALAGCGAVFAWRSRDDSLRLLAATAGIYLVFGFVAIFVFFVRRDGGYLTGLEWGTRNLLTLYPLAAILSLLVWKSVGPQAGWGKMGTTLVVTLGVTIVLGLNFQFRGVQMLVRSHRLVAEWQAALPAGEPVVTDVWWLPAVMAPFFLRSPMLCAANQSVLAAWLPGAASKGLNAFTFASLEPIHERRVAALTIAPEGAEERVSGLYLRRFQLLDSSVRPQGREGD